VKRAHTKTRTSRAGFTLAEVAVTIVIVGIGMLLVLQGLNTAKMTAAHTRNYKLSRELALLTLGQIASGEFREDVEDGLVGSYAEEGYPEFTFEVLVGDATFRTKNDNGEFDSWAPRDEDLANDDDEEEAEDAEQPFEKVRIKITSPLIGELKNELVLERWIPWKQVYGESEEDAATANADTGTGSTSNGSNP
jgi:prepilin-type N-terminal cleavage/methylation domain-containing protein